MYNNMNYSIKIELLYIEDNLVSTLVHFGGNNSVSLLIYLLVSKISA